MRALHTEARIHLPTDAQHLVALQAQSQQREKKKRALRESVASTRAKMAAGSPACEWSSACGCGETDRLSFAIAVEPEDEQVAVASQRLELTRKLLKRLTTKRFAHMKTARVS